LILKSQNLIAIFFITFLISCSSHRRFIRVDPLMAFNRSEMDTIAVFSDALAAINAKNGFYSANSAYLLDTLILTGVQEVLKGKGYKIRLINPLFSGSFMDSLQKVPVKNLNEDKIEIAQLPLIFKNELSENQLKAFERTCRSLYLQTINNKNIQVSLNISDPNTDSDIKTLRNVVGCGYVLFIFHQAGLVDPDLTDNMELGTMALTGILSGGRLLIGYTKVSIYHTYIILLQLTTGKIIWSNYTPFDAAPIDPVFKISRRKVKSLAGYIKNPDIWGNVMWRWKEFNLEPFPRKNDSRMYMGGKKEYPASNFFMVK
jgi:hypothetical protein